MPGLVGIVSTRDTRSNGQGVNVALLAAMEGAMPLNPDWIRRDWSQDANACQFVCFARNESSSTAIARSGSSTIAFDGELFGCPAGKTEQASYLVDRFVKLGAKGLEDLEGRFVAAIWCEESQRLSLLTDKFTSKPLYYAVSDQGLAFGTSIRGLKAWFRESPPINRDGIIQFFTFGHLWNDDTFYQPIRVAQPAALIQFDTNTGSLTVEQYWRPVQTRRLPKQDSLERITTCLGNAVDDQSRDTPGLGVALSGGLDARTMLALIDTDHVRPACVSLGMEGSLDQRSSRQLAELAGCPFHSLVLGEGFLENFRQHLERMVWLTDGHYLSQCIVLPTFPLYESLGVQVLLRGHVGELLHMHKAYNFSIDSEFASITDGDGLKQWLWSHLQSHLTAGVPEPLLQGVDAGTFAESGRRSLDRALSATKQFEHPLDRISQLFLDQRTRRETAMSLVKFSSVVDARIPYLDSRFISAVFATEPELRIDEEIQAYVLRKRRPSFLKPANSNTGAPVGVSELRRKLCYIRMRVLAKLGVKGYQPYERLGLWLKRELRPLVESILLDPRCLDRGLLNPDCVRGVVQRHMSDRANHTYLLMAMMIVELGLADSKRERTAIESLNCATIL